MSTTPRTTRAGNVQRNEWVYLAEHVEAYVAELRRVADVRERELQNAFQDAYRDNLRNLAAWIRRPGNITRDDAIDDCARLLENNARHGRLVPDSASARVEWRAEDEGADLKKAADPEALLAALTKIEALVRGVSPTFAINVAVEVWHIANAVLAAARAQGGMSVRQVWTCPECYAEVPVTPAPDAAKDAEIARLGADADACRLLARAVMSLWRYAGIASSPDAVPDQDTVVDGIDLRAVVDLYRGDRLAMAHALVQIRNAAGALREQLEQRSVAP